MTGSEFEKAVEKLLKDNGWWVHRFAKAKDGSQPFDILAMKDNRLCAYDCKVLNGNAERFPFSRVEDNQFLSFAMLESRVRMEGAGEVGFLIYSKGRIYFLGSYVMKMMDNLGVKSARLERLYEWKYQLEVKSE